jgi:N-acetyl-anhydromuramyl-L-alanine amidase AmpD
LFISAVTTREESGVEPAEINKIVFRTENYPKDLPTTNIYTSTGLIYFPEETEKTQIVLHHTATSNTSNEMKGILTYWGGEKQKTTGGFIDSPISTHYIIDRDGNFVQVMPENYWAYNSSPAKNKSIQKQQVSIELMSDGWVDKKEKSDGEVYYQRGGGKEYKSIDVARPVKLIVNKNNTHQLAFSHTTYRGKSYFVKYTDAQLLKLEEIILDISRNNINDLGL